MGFRRICLSWLLLPPSFRGAWSKESCQQQQQLQRRPSQQTLPASCHSIKPAAWARTDIHAHLLSRPAAACLLCCSYVVQSMERCSIDSVDVGSTPGSVAVAASLKESTQVHTGEGEGEPEVLRCGEEGGDGGLQGR